MKVGSYPLPWARVVSSLCPGAPLLGQSVVQPSSALTPSSSYFTSAPAFPGAIRAHSHTSWVSTAGCHLSLDNFLSFKFNLYLEKKNWVKYVPWFKDQNNIKSILGGWCLMKIAPTLFSVFSDLFPFSLHRWPLVSYVISPVFPYADWEKKILIKFLLILIKKIVIKSYPKLAFWMCFSAAYCFQLGFLQPFKTEWIAPVFLWYSICIYIYYFLSTCHFYHTYICV